MSPAYNVYLMGLRLLFPNKKCTSLLQRKKTALVVAVSIAAKGKNQM